ncbi:MAG: hypothetical protein M3N16_01815 [Actinomycetota bacterium]|nr:hypothetical protein [Actinomycetota bacterium]
MRKLFVVPALALAALAAAPAHASQPPEIVRFPLAGELFVNPCNGEPVEIVRGEFQIVFHSTADGGGGFHTIAEGNAKGVEGVSPSGRYRFGGGFWAEFNTGPNRAETFTVTDVFNAISQGSVENFTLETAVHFTIDANGRPTSVVANFADGTCRG